MNSLVTALVDLNPTRADYANVRHALAAATERGLTLDEAQMVLTTATEKVVGDLMATALTQPDAGQGTAADLDDPTKPTAQEVLALDAILTRALAVYNGRRPPYTVGAAIGTDSGIKSMAVVAPRRTSRASFAGTRSTRASCSWSMTSRRSSSRSARSSAARG